MKIYTKMRIILLILTVVMVILVASPNVSVAALDSVNLGSTSNFAVLAGSTITNTGPTVINGNVGLFPGTSFTQANAKVNGEVHLTDAIATSAQNDLTTAYVAAAGMGEVNTIASELGGTILKPGTYNAGTFGITGTLTLDAEGNSDAVFIFKSASSLITASGSNIKLINGANSCQVFWVVGSSATLGTNSNFVGTILAQESITATTGASIQGKLLARTGAVTLDNNVINGNTCFIAPSTAPVEPIDEPEEEEQQEEEEEEVPVIDTPETPEAPETPVEVAPVVDAVVVEAVPSVPVTTTVTGGRLPKTSLDLNSMFLIGAALILVGALGLRYRKSHE